MENISVAIFKLLMRFNSGPWHWLTSHRVGSSFWMASGKWPSRTGVRHGSRKRSERVTSGSVSPLLSNQEASSLLHPHLSFCLHAYLTCLFLISCFLIFSLGIKDNFSPKWPNYQTDPVTLTCSRGAAGNPNHWLHSHQQYRSTKSFSWREVCSDARAVSTLSSCFTDQTGNSPGEFQNNLSGIMN